MRLGVCDARRRFGAGPAQRNVLGEIRSALNIGQQLQSLPWLIGAMIVTSCVHEAGHAWVAWRLGDRRPEIEKRKRVLSWSHISLPFTIILPSVLWIFTGLMLGGAKPVMVSTQAIGPWRMVLVSLAGPVGNFLTGIVSLAIFAGLVHAGQINALSDQLAGKPGAFSFAIMAIGLSFFLGVLNLLPLPPLDGSRVVAAFLPERARNFFYHALSLPCAALIVLGLFILGRYYPQTMAPVNDFYVRTLPRWTANLVELIQ
jgi:Zn-dependent protease